MKKNLIILGALAVSTFAFGQVGVNNQSPKATLDVTAKQTDATTAEGLIAPRLTGDQILGKDAQYTAAQTGTLIYATSAVTTPSGTKTANITSAGYYYFNGTLWVKIAAPVGAFDSTDDAWRNLAGRVELGTLANGTTARPVGTEFVSLDDGSVGIGTSAPVNKFQVVGGDTSTSITNATTNILSNITNNTGGAVVQTMVTGPREIRTGINPLYQATTGSPVTPIYSMLAFTTATGEINGNFLQYDFPNKNLLLAPPLVSNQSINNVGIGVFTPTSKLQVNGSFSLPVRITTSTTATVTGDDYTIIGGTAANLNLPSATGIQGRIYVFVYGGVNFNVVAPAATPFYIRGNTLTSYGINNTAGGSSVTVQSTGLQWLIIGSN